MPKEETDWPGNLETVLLAIEESAYQDSKPELSETVRSALCSNIANRAQVRGGCFGPIMLSSRGYAPRKLGLNRAYTFESGDSLLGLALRNNADPSLVAELLAAGASRDHCNDEGQRPAEIEPALFAAGCRALAQRRRLKRP